MFECPICSGQLVVCADVEGDYFWCLGCRATLPTDEAFYLEALARFRSGVRAAAAARPRQAALL